MKPSKIEFSSYFLDKVINSIDNENIDEINNLSNHFDKNNKSDVIFEMFNITIIITTTTITTI